jgi:hypothetical protein
MITKPIPVSLRLPDLNHRGYSDRLLAFHKGEWHIARYYPGGPDEGPRWPLEGSSFVPTDVTHWLPLPEDPTRQPLLSVPMAKFLFREARKVGDVVEVQGESYTVLNVEPAEIHVDQGSASTVGAFRIDAMPCRAVPLATRPIQTEDDAQAVVSSVAGYLLDRRDATPGPTGELTRNFCHQLLESGIQSSAGGCDLCQG